jgi:hypothetical protein
MSGLNRLYRCVALMVVVTASVSGLALCGSASAAAPRSFTCGSVSGVSNGTADYAQFGTCGGNTSTDNGGYIPHTVEAPQVFVGRETRTVEWVGGVTTEVRLRTTVASARVTDRAVKTGACQPGQTVLVVTGTVVADGTGATKPGSPVSGRLCRSGHTFNLEFNTSFSL